VLSKSRGHDNCRVGELGVNLWSNGRTMPVSSGGRLNDRKQRNFTLRTINYAAIPRSRNPLIFTHEISRMRCALIALIYIFPTKFWMRTGFCGRWLASGTSAPTKHALLKARNTCTINMQRFVTKADVKACASKSVIYGVGVDYSPMFSIMSW
jgi:hypothetical protein